VGRLAGDRAGPVAGDRRPLRRARGAARYRARRRGQPAPRPGRRSGRLDLARRRSPRRRDLRPTDPAHRGPAQVPQPDHRGRGLVDHAQEYDRLGRPPAPPLEPMDIITLGFDGSKTDDHSALMACRVTDGAMFGLGVWDPAEHGGEAPRDQIDGKVRWAFGTYDVVGFFSDLEGWESYVDRWDEELGRERNRELLVKAAPSTGSPGTSGPAVASSPSRRRAPARRDRRGRLPARREPPGPTALPQRATPPERLGCDVRQGAPRVEAQDRLRPGGRPRAPGPTGLPRPAGEPAPAPADGPRRVLSAHRRMSNITWTPAAGGP